MKPDPFRQGKIGRKDALPFLDGFEIPLDRLRQNGARLVAELRSLQRR